jgi:hypothetical protein
MSLKDLRDLGVLLPSEEWGQHDLSTTVNKAALILALILVSGAMVLMYAGNGGTLTLVGMGVFFAFVAWITRISLRAVREQAARFEEQREEFRSEEEDLPEERGTV